MGINRTPDKKTQPKITDFTRKRPFSEDDESEQPAQKSNRTEESNMTSTSTSDPTPPALNFNKDTGAQSAPPLTTDERLEKIMAAIIGLSSETKAISSETKALSSEVKNMNTINQEHHEQTQKEIKVINHRVATLEEAHTEHEDVIKTLRRENEFLKKKARENNVIFFGLKEKTDETNESLQEELVKKLQQAGISNVSIDFVHRMGAPKQGKTRGIRMRLVKLSDKNRIIREKKNLKDIFAHEDLPPETLKVHKTIEALVKKLREKGQKAQNRGHFAIVDGQRVYHEEAEQMLKEQPNTDGTSNNQMEGIQ